MNIKIGDLILKDGTTVCEINDERNKYLMCNPCPYYGDVCDGDMTDVDVEVPSGITLAIRDDIINNLREYAEKKFQNGEIDIAHGILKAVCKIRQDYESEMQDAEHTQ